MKKNHIVIAVEGGVIQHVAVSEETQVTIIDFDEDVEVLDMFDCLTWEQEGEVAYLVTDEYSPKKEDLDLISRVEDRIRESEKE